MNTSEYNQYDFLFIGMGAANSLLLLRLYRSGQLRNKRIGVIDPDTSTNKEKTFCFWATDQECENLGLTHLIDNTWHNLKISGSTHQHISPLGYRHVSGKNLHDQAMKIVELVKAKHYHTHLTAAPVINGHSCHIKLGDETIEAFTVFDSRPPQYALQPSANHLYQSFWGWEIETDNEVFDTHSAVLMDFSVEQHGQCQFMYVLPFSKNRALVEFTRFGKELLLEQESVPVLEKYISSISTNYTIVRTEKGIIPMTNATILTENNGSMWHHTGARAGLIKSTTGYAFHAMAEDAVRISAALITKRPVERVVPPQRFAYYDRLLLSILERQPASGKPIFETLFSKVPAPQVLQFLREKSAPRDEVVLFSKLPIGLFLRYAVADVFRHVKYSYTSLVSLFAAILMVVLFAIRLDELAWLIMGAGFMAIGLPHGAVDHLTSVKQKSTQALSVFISKYLFVAALFGALWYALPDLALVMFLVFSAWHFGQTDFKEWRLHQNTLAFLWGSCLLLLILATHFYETQNILSHIPGLAISSWLLQFSSAGVLTLQLTLATAALTMAVAKRSYSMYITLGCLGILTVLPVGMAFAVYFIFQHSLLGWKHLTHELRMDSAQLWKKSAPFSIAGALIILTGTLLIQTHYLSVFFIVLSCISLPHIFFMHSMYSGKTSAAAASS
jgi:lycopene beta-cyclase